MQVASKKTKQKQFSLIVAATFVINARYGQTRHNLLPYYMLWQFSFFCVDTLETRGVKMLQRIIMF